MSTIRLLTAIGVMVTTFSVSCVSSVSLAEESWQALMSTLPSDANALVMVNVDKVRNSPFAKAAGWNSAENAAGGLRSILPRGEVQRATFAARLNLLDLSPQWEVGVLETKSDPTLEAFSVGIGGPREMLGTAPSVRLPFDAYLLKLAPHLFGMRGPADRQKAARWSREAASAKSLDSVYLTKIAEFPETVGTEVMLGIDLTDAVDLAWAKQILSESPTIRDAKIDPDVAAQIAVSLEGVALGVRVLDQAIGKIRVDFARDPAPLAKVMKPFLLERLAARGAMIPEFDSWTLEIKGNTAFLGGTLTPVGLSRVLSVIEPELPASHATATPTTPTQTAATQPTTPSLDSPSKTAKPTTVSIQQLAQPSKQHFTKVKALVTEVRFPSSELKVNTASAFGVWIERQARRIDQLPILDVDPDLLDYSQGVAQSLRVTAGKLRGASIRASVYSNNSYAYNDSGYAVQGGYYQGNTMASPKQIQSRMETAAANLSHVDTMRMIDDETATIRRIMTERYRVEF